MICLQYCRCGLHGLTSSLPSGVSVRARRWPGRIAILKSAVLPGFSDLRCRNLRIVVSSWIQSITRSTLAKRCMMPTKRRRVCTSTRASIISRSPLMLALGSWGLQTASETDTHCSFEKNGKKKRPKTVEYPHAHGQGGSGRAAEGSGHRRNCEYLVTNVHRTNPRCPSCRGSGGDSGTAASL